MLIQRLRTRTSPRRTGAKQCDTRRAYCTRGEAADGRSATNICFGDSDGSGEYRDAHITVSGTGKLLHMRWPNRGLRLNYL